VPTVIWSWQVRRGDGEERVKSNNLHLTGGENLTKS